MIFLSFVQSVSNSNFVCFHTRQVSLDTYTLTTPKFFDRVPRPGSTSSPKQLRHQERTKERTTKNEGYSWFATLRTVSNLCASVVELFRKQNQASSCFCFLQYYSGITIDSHISCLFIVRKQRVGLLTEVRNKNENAEVNCRTK